MKASEISDGSKYIRHGIRWLDDVLQDLKLLKVTALWKKAQDRDSWKFVIKEGKAHKWL
jgi:hypothetical protein